MSCIQVRGGDVKYKFIPEPNILLLILDEESLGTNIPMDKFVRSNMPESLEEARVRLMEDSLAEELVNMVDVNPLMVASFELMV